MPWTRRVYLTLRAFWLYITHYATPNLNPLKDTPKEELENTLDSLEDRLERFVKDCQKKRMPFRQIKRLAEKKFGEEVKDLL